MGLPEVKLKPASSGWIEQIGPMLRTKSSNGDRGPKRILIIDDDAAVRKATSLKLSASGYEVTTAADASEAIGAVRDTKPDLIIVDINFAPDISSGGGVSWDGFQIMFWLRSHVDARHARFIVISTDNSQENKKRARQGGAVAFLSKPLDTKALLPAIEAILG